MFHNIPSLNKNTVCTPSAPHIWLPQSPTGPMLPAFTTSHCPPEMQKVIKIAELHFWQKKISTKKMAKKWPKIAQKLPKIAHNGPKMTQNCQNGPKITQNGPKISTS